MKLYLLQFNYSVEAKNEFLDDRYLDNYDYAEVVIVEMEINKKTWKESEEIK